LPGRLAGLHERPVEIEKHRTNGHVNAWPRPRHGAR
jgi:hypothetical protein